MSLYHPGCLSTPPPFAVPVSQNLNRHAETLSHELRTPMQGIFGGLDLMRATIQRAQANGGQLSTQELFAALEENICTIQDSARRAIEAADNIVRAFELNMEVPIQMSEALSTPALASSFEAQRAIATLALCSAGPERRASLKRRLSESDNKSPLQSKRRDASGFIEERHAIFPRVLFPERPRRDSDHFQHSITAASTPISKPSTATPEFLNGFARGLHMTNVREVLHHVVCESITVGNKSWISSCEPAIHGLAFRVHTKSNGQSVKVRIVRLTIEPSVPHYIFVDERSFAKAISSLLSNAMKFTDSGDVSLRSTFNEEARMVEILVRDEGPGISPWFRPQLFSAFSREDTSRSRQTEGLGLGLMVAKGLARRMGGDLVLVSAETEGPEKGTEFALSIPASPSVHQPYSLPSTTADFAVDAYRTEDADGHHWSPRSIFKHIPSNAQLLATPPPSSSSSLSPRPSLVKTLGYEPRATSEPPQEPPSPVSPHVRLAALKSSQQGHFDSTLASTHPMTFLIAEDNAINRRLLVNMLTKLGYDPRSAILEACDGVEAIAQVEASLPPGPSKDSSTFSSAGVPLTTPNAARLDIPPRAAAARAANPSRPIDVVLMDLWMPKVDGFTATRRILQLCAESGVKGPTVLAMTADSTEGVAAQAAGVGMEGLMLKPFSIRDLQRLITQAWKVRNGDRW